jgi:hypothetical protein
MVTIVTSRLAIKPVATSSTAEQVLQVSRKRRRVRKHVVMALPDKVARQETVGSISKRRDEV